MKLVILLILSTCSYAANKTCRALVLQDGGDFVFFQAGAVKTLLEKYNYDVVVGTGFSSFLAVQVAQGLTGEQIHNYWSQFEQEKVLKQWRLGAIEAFNNKAALYNTTILLETTSKLIGQASFQKRLSILSTDINSGKGVAVNENTNFNDLVIGVTGSASEPYYYLPVAMGSKKLLSGSIITEIDLQSAVARCKEIVEHDYEIIIDAVLVSEKHIRQKDTSNYKGIQMAKRYFELNKYVSSMVQYFHAKTDHPSVNFNHFVYPLSELKDTNVPFGNSKDQNLQMMKQGEVEAQIQIQTPLPLEQLIDNYRKLYLNLYKPELSNEQQ